MGAIARDASVDYSHGSVITSSIHPEPHTHIEAVRYPTVITDVVSRKWVADVTSTEETSVQVQAAFTRALRDEGLLEMIEERSPAQPLQPGATACQSDT